MSVWEFLFSVDSITSLCNRIPINCFGKIIKDKNRVTRIETVPEMYVLGGGEGSDY